MGKGSSVKEGGREGERREGGREREKRKERVSKHAELSEENQSQRRKKKKSRPRAHLLHLLQPRS